MTDLLIADADRDAVIASGLLLPALEGAVTYRVVASLPEATRLLHDARRTYTRITILGVPAADSGSLRSALTVLQARGTRVRWFDSHEMLWTTEVREQLDRLDVEVHLPDPHRPETERAAGLVLADLETNGRAESTRSYADAWTALREARTAELGGPGWVTLVDAVVHDHRIVANRSIRAAAARVWEPDEPFSDAEHRMIAVQRSREGRAERYLDRLVAETPFGEQVVSIDARGAGELRYLRPRFYAEPARRRTGAEYVQVLVGNNWLFTCRDQFGSGLDLPVAYLERLFDLDVSVSGYPYRSTTRVESGADLNDRLLKVLPDAIEDERKGRNRPIVPAAFDEDIDW